MGILGWLTLAFVGAKLFGIIDWSWWVVLSPTIVGFVFVLFFLGAWIWAELR